MRLRLTRRFQPQKVESELGMSVSVHLNDLHLSSADYANVGELTATWG